MKTTEGDDTLPIRPMSGPGSDGLPESPHKGKTGLLRIWNAFGYSMEGLKAAIRNEDAFRQEILLAAILIPLALVLGVGRVETAMMIRCV